jgi:hypothetical protein
MIAESSRLHLATAETEVRVIVKREQVCPAPAAMLPNPETMPRIPCEVEVDGRKRNHV